MHCSSAQTQRQLLTRGTTACTALSTYLLACKMQAELTIADGVSRTNSAGGAAQRGKNESVFMAQTMRDQQRSSKATGNRSG